MAVGTLSVTILGCGTSSGVPRISNDWGDCDRREPKNRRTRASILVQSAATTILVDTSPDMRAQLLMTGIGVVDAILWTHDHADHTHGIDDVRQIFHQRGTPVPGFAQPETVKLLKRRFGYVFEGGRGYPPTVELSELHDQTIGDITVHTVAQPHGPIWSSGFRFDLNGLSIGYSTDFHEVTAEMIALFSGVDIWIIDALRVRPHPTHANLAQALEAIAAARPARAILTHMDQSMDYATLKAQLPTGIEPGYDGMRLDLAETGA